MLESAAFPNGLPKALEASVAVQLLSQGATSDSDLGRFFPFSLYCYGSDPTIGDRWLFLPLWRRVSLLDSPKGGAQGQKEGQICIRVTSINPFSFGIPDCSEGPELI